MLSVVHSWYSLRAQHWLGIGDYTLVWGTWIWASPHHVQCATRNLDAMIYIYIYVVAINNLLLRISCSNRTLLYESYCNRLQIIGTNNLDQIIVTISLL